MDFISVGMLKDVVSKKDKLCQSTGSGNLELTEQSDTKKGANVMLDKRWHLARDGKMEGPYTKSEVKEKINLGEIDEHFFVFGPGDKEWQLLIDSEAFADVFVDHTQPPPPPPPSGAASSSSAVNQTQKQKNQIKNVNKSHLAGGDGG